MLLWNAAENLLDGFMHHFNMKRSKNCDNLGHIEEVLRPDLHLVPLDLNAVVSEPAGKFMCILPAAI